MKKPAPEFPAPRRYARDEHTISRRQISSAALKVLNRLHEGGFRACLVGGGVRDLLLGREPKDFDIATDALPEEVHKLFRNSRLIGRRFRLAHVRFGPEIIEVATFRAAHVAGDGAARTNDEGRILRDNVYGTIDDDVWRRDFTVNALYYDIADFSVIDYVGGVEDLEKGVMRLIGDPDVRYREDPVRMLRAIRFAVKLGFQIDKSAATPIAKNGHLLEEISSARLFDEMLKLFHGGCAQESFEALDRHGLLTRLFPLSTLAGTNGGTDSLVRRALENTDNRIRQGKSVTPAFLVAALLWDAAMKACKKLEKDGMSPHDSLAIAADEVISRQTARVAIPRRFTQMTREIWTLQSRLERRTPARSRKVYEHARFRAAYDFLLLRAADDTRLAELCDWWTRFQEVDENERETMLSGLKKNSGGRSRRRRRDGDAA